MADPLSDSPGETINLTIPAKNPKSVAVPCPMCGNESADISVNLWLLELGDNAFTCHDCGEEFTVERVRFFVTRWSALLNWIDKVPVFEE